MSDFSSFTLNASRVFSGGNRKPGNGGQQPQESGKAADERAGRAAVHERLPGRPGRDHQDPAVAEPVRPRARVQGEDQAGQPVAAVRNPISAASACTATGLRDRDGRDLITEHGDRLGAPVPAELPLAEQFGDAPRRVHAAAGSPGPGLAHVTLACRSKTGLTCGDAVELSVDVARRIGCREWGFGSAPGTRASRSGKRC